MAFQPKDVDGVLRYSKGQAAHMRTGREELAAQLLVALTFGDDVVYVDGVMPFSLPQVVDEMKRLTRCIEFHERATSVVAAAPAPLRTDLLNAVWFAAA